MHYFRRNISLHLPICAIKMKMTKPWEAVANRYVYLKTQPLIMHQSIAVILLQLYYTKISFLVINAINIFYSSLVNNSDWLFKSDDYFNQSESVISR